MYKRLKGWDLRETCSSPNTGRFVLLLFWAPRLWQYIPEEASFLCDKPSVLGATLKESPCVITKGEFN
jgi:hypothetical protein